jgi:hypothetical protein
MLQIRDLTKISINIFGRLFQQNAVDMYTKIEVQRLGFIKSKKGQKSIRAEMYKIVQDAINNCRKDLSNIGNN